MQSVSLPSCSFQFLSACECGTPISASYCLAECPLCPGFLSLPLLTVWMNVSFLTPWLLDFHTVQFFDSSGCFLFLYWLSSFFWLCKEAKHIYLHLHLGCKSDLLILFIFFQSSLKDTPPLLLEIKEERERESETSMWETNIDWLRPTSAWTRDRTCNPGKCLDQELNP